VWLVPVPLAEGVWVRVEERPGRALAQGLSDVGILRAGHVQCGAEPVLELAGDIEPPLEVDGDAESPAALLLQRAVRVERLELERGKD
jgi:hypothetical protein